MRGIRILVVVALALPGLLRAQNSNSVGMELAGLREDVRLLNQRVGELAMTVEQLTRENSSLQSKANQSYVTLEQLNRAIADLNRAMQSAMADQKRDVLQRVATQIENLGRQTNSALDSMAKNQATRAAVQTNFAEDFPKQGVNYTVQSGDTISTIAQKTGARAKDIINANKITDPSRLRVGQTLFIPQAP